MNLDAAGKPVPSSRPTKHVCGPVVRCRWSADSAATGGQPMVLRKGRRGPFLACSGYPKCENTKDVDAQGNPIQPIETGVTCGPG